MKIEALDVSNENELCMSLIFFDKDRFFLKKKLT